MPQYLSEEGIQQHRQELEELKLKRQEIATRLEEAKALGDLSENQEYISAREAQAFNEGKILELEQLLRDAVVIDKNHRSGIVHIGSTVEVRANGRSQTLTIVGSEEANPAAGKISNESPLGKAFLGHKAGDAVEVETPGGKTTYKIVSLS
ncbi:MAG: Transcription elongation factor GreA [Parcubacteria group bacterium GW2011_GWA2_43_9b]|uniref:Transcription elongation factor GreA n=1 Tax=Candidatus Portnoybacteria bacterium RIFCSPLOWO2_02_FULL_39_11 TaxID=1802001 RepID=A0A1G2FNL8_9BACT|nr:MAG: Transcription elongation factor GreA [Parcubacteria group bacterium GW2011_GWA2_43_9b]OGZ39633.1 MAG: transcription elongation factor GreA [Candidatus Portnoybacteria bacterium RIFCSPLOWO2_02_FULL_39_11]